jgi:hypothetical protein
MKRFTRFTKDEEVYKVYKNLDKNRNKDEGKEKKPLWCHGHHPSPHLLECMLAHDSQRIVPTRRRRRRNREAVGP